MRKIMTIALISFFMIIPVCAISTTYYVSKDGNNSNDGTIENPWNTITYAITKLKPNDILFIREGLYSERPIISNNGTEKAPITIRSFPNEYVEINGLPTGQLNTIVITGTYIVIDGFTITNQNYLKTLDSVAYWVELNGKYITLKNCRIIASGNTPYNYWELHAKSRGIAVSGLHNTIEHCYIRGQEIGITIAGLLPRFTTLRLDTLHSHGASNIVIQSSRNDAAYDRTIQGNLIEYCEIDTSWEEDNIQFEPNYLDHTQTYNLGTIIRKSKLGHAAENCIDLKGAESILIDECLLYSSSGDDNGPRGGNDNSGGAGIELGFGETSRYVIIRRCVIWDNNTGAHMYDGYRYYNNTFLNNRRSYMGSNCDYPTKIFVGLETWNFPKLKRSFINNIVGMQPNTAIFNFDMTYGANFELNNNLYFDLEGPIKFWHSITSPKSLTVGLDEWKNILNKHPGYAYMTGKDENSIEENPQFMYVPDYPVDYNSYWNFNLRRKSEAINAGVTVTKTTNEGEKNTLLYVEDSRFFCDGFGITSGDIIQIGKSEPVHIVSINYEDNSIILEFPRCWNVGDGVHLKYIGNAPDIGAFESDYPLDIKTEKIIPINYELKQNYPNPFNSTTIIEYHLPEESKVLLTIHDTLGRVKTIIINEVQEAGIHKAELNGNLLGSSGPYFYVLQTNKFTKVKKLLYIK